MCTNLSEQRTENALRLFHKGMQFFKFREYSAAEEFLRRATDVDPQLAEAWDTLGHIYWDANQYQKARECYDNAIKARPDWAEAWKHLGLLEFTYYHLTESVNALLSYMKLGGDDISVLMTLVNAALENNDCQTVLRVTSRILELDEEIAEAWRVRGICQARMSRYNAACVSLNMALEYDPEEVEASNLVGDLCYEAGDYLRSVDFYEMSLSANPHQPRILFRYGTALWIIERWPEAIPILERYVELMPDDPKGWNNLGVVLREKGEVKRAIECYKRALELDPELSAAKKNMRTASSMKTVP